jgi:hypothetical protein
MAESKTYKPTDTDEVADALYSGIISELIKKERKPKNGAKEIDGAKERMTKQGLREMAKDQRTKSIDDMKKRHVTMTPHHCCVIIDHLLNKWVHAGWLMLPIRNVRPMI